MTTTTCAFVPVRLIALIGLLVGTPGLTAGPTASLQVEPDRAIRAALQQAGIEPRRIGAEVIVAWNAVAHDLAFAEDQFLTFKGQRALAMMHLAMHDALNAIVPIYAGYANAERRLAHPLAASAQAAHDVFRYATDSGLEMGRRVARHTLSHSLQPRQRREEAERD